MFALLCSQGVVFTFPRGQPRTSFGHFASLSPIDLLVVAYCCTMTKIGKRRLSLRADLITLYRIEHRCTSFKRQKGVAWVFGGCWKRALSCLNLCQGFFSGYCWRGILHRAKIKITLQGTSDEESGGSGRMFAMDLLLTLLSWRSRSSILGQSSRQADVVLDPLQKTDKSIAVEINLHCYWLSHKFWSVFSYSCLFLPPTLVYEIYICIQAPALRAIAISYENPYFRKCPTNIRQ